MMKVGISGRCLFFNICFAYFNFAYNLSFSKCGCRLKSFILNALKTFRYQKKILKVTNIEEKLPEKLYRPIMQLEEVLKPFTITNVRRILQNDLVLNGFYDSNDERYQV